MVNKGSTAKQFLKPSAGRGDWAGEGAASDYRSWMKKHSGRGSRRKVYAQLTGDRQIVQYSREDGANWHCEPMGRLEVELRMPLF